MPKYIDADKLKVKEDAEYRQYLEDRHQYAHIFDFRPLVLSVHRMIQHLIGSAPAEDVRPEIYSEWDAIIVFGNFVFTCENCHTTFTCEIGEEDENVYCRKCGAKFKKGGAE